MYREANNRALKGDLKRGEEFYSEGVIGTRPTTLFPFS